MELGEGVHCLWRWPRSVKGFEARIWKGSRWRKSFNESELI